MSGQLRSVMFTRRNKDNKHIEGFKEKRINFLTIKSIEELQYDFDAFVKSGPKGAMNRLYISVNTRKNDLTQKKLIHYLIDNDVKLQNLPSKVMALSMEAECAETKKWLFDYDDDNSKIDEFISDIKNLHDDVTVEKHKTVNGYAVIIDKRIDTRGLLKKWTDVELQRDGFLCALWKENN